MEFHWGCRKCLTKENKWECNSRACNLWAKIMNGKLCYSPLNNQDAEEGRRLWTTDWLSAPPIVWATRSRTTVLRTSVAGRPCQMPNRCGIAPGRYPERVESKSIHPSINQAMFRPKNARFDFGLACLTPGAVETTNGTVNDIFFSGDQCIWCLVKQCYPTIVPWLFQGCEDSLGKPLSQCVFPSSAWTDTGEDDDYLYIVIVIVYYYDDGGGDADVNDDHDDCKWWATSGLGGDSYFPW